MGRSRKKPASKVDAAPAVVAPPTKPMKKGKRGVEKVVEKQVVGSKKQKIVNGGVEQAVEKKKFERKTRKNTKKELTSSSEECRSFESEEEHNKEQPKGKGAAALIQKHTVDTKNGAATVSKNEPSAESHSEDGKENSQGDMKEENAKVASPPKNFPSSAVQNGSIVAPVEKGKGESSEDTSSEESGSDEEQVEVTPAKKLAATIQDAKKASISNEESQEKDGDDGSKMEDEHRLKTPKNSDTDVEMVDASLLKKKPQTPITSQATGSKTVFMGNLSYAIEEDDVKNFFKDAGEIAEIRFAMREDRFAGYGHVEFKTAEAAQEALKLNNEVLLDRPVRLDLARERSAHLTTTPQVIGSKTVYLGNLSYAIEEDDVKNFFKDVGEVAEVRFAIRDDRFAGFGHVEFTTAEAAQEALKLNNTVLLDQRVKLDLAKERGAYTPGSGKEKSYQKGGQAQGKTVFVRGFDPSDGFDNIRSTLEKHFGNCGEISRMSIPKDYESGAPKGLAFIDFADGNGFSRALELNGSEVGGRLMTVEEAKPRSDSREGSGHGGGRGFGGGRSGGSASFSGGRGGRFSGGLGGRGGRGRGPSRP